MSRINIALSYKGESYSLSLNKTTSIKEQVNRYLSLVSEDKLDNLCVVYNSSILSDIDTTSSLKIKNGNELEAYNTLSTRQADPSLVAH